MQIAAVLLAAGGSQRLGSPKQLASFRGKTLVASAASAAVESVCDPIIAVVGSRATLVSQALSALAVTVTYNPRWHEGVGSSIGFGIRAVRRRCDPQGVAILLADQPFLSSKVIDRVVAVFGSSGGMPAACGYGDTSGPPAVFPRECFEELAQLSGDRGAKVVLRRYGARVSVVPFEQGRIDIDTREDLANLTEGAIDV